MITTYDINLYSNSADDDIRIHEDADGTGMIVVKTASDYWGKIDFSMDKNDAVVANAILKAVEFAKAR